jgi:coenzyme F420-reducing hydrogenase delta subunit
VHVMSSLPISPNSQNALPYETERTVFRLCRNILETEEIQDLTKNNKIFKGKSKDAFLISLDDNLRDLHDIMWRDCEHYVNAVQDADKKIQAKQKRLETLKIERDSLLKQQIEIEEEEKNREVISEINKFKSSPISYILGRENLDLKSEIFLITVFFLPGLKNNKEQSRKEISLWISSAMRIKQPLQLINESLERIRLEETKLRVDRSKEADLFNLIKEADEAISTRIKPELILALSKFTKSYDPILPSWFSTPGLSEVFNSEYELSRKHKQLLLDLIEQMPGGSIGISGPRGVGKTTLMRALCGDDSSVDRIIQGKKVLSIMLSAPVQYDSREFILHVFSSICRKVIQPTGEYHAFQDEQILSSSDDEYPAPQSDSKLANESLDSWSQRSLKYPINTILYRILDRRGYTVCLYIGLLLISASLGIANLLVNYSVSIPVVAAPFSSPEIPTSSTELETKSPKNSDLSTSKMSSRQDIAKYVKALEIKPGNILLWGLIQGIRTRIGERKSVI